jgi:subtilisin family serine protease
MRSKAFVLAALCAVLSLAVSAEAGSRHLVLFGGSGVPSGFETDVQARGGAVAFSHAAGVAIVEGLSNAAAARLVGRNGVQRVDPDSTFPLDARAGDVQGIWVEDGTESPSNPATAFFYPRQWNMRAIKADQAWMAGRLGSPSVTLAILDSGISYTHADLAGRVDLSRSVSFVPSDDALVATYFPAFHPVTDLQYHGTHVAATAVSNSLAAAGVTTQTTLVGIKVCDIDGSCSFAAVIQGILHAADVGADVANMSLGGAFSKSGNGRYVGYINKVFNYAHSQGMTVVVSAGNSATDLDHDKNSYKTYCSTPNTICVSATGPTAQAGVNGPWTNVDAPAYYTNYGRSAINVAAPGGNNDTFVYAACSRTSLVIPVCQTGTYIVGVQGTSMAAPHVSGLASLVVEDVGKDPGQVRARIQQTADDLGARGTDPFYGKGRINVGRAAQ